MVFNASRCLSVNQLIRSVVRDGLIVWRKWLRDCGMHIVRNLYAFLGSECAIDWMRLNSSRYSFCLARREFWMNESEPTGMPQKSFPKSLANMACISCKLRFLVRLANEGNC